MCSPWETPLCCTDTRRRFSALGKSAGKITRVKGKPPAHVAVFLLLAQWFFAVNSFENDSSRSTHILQLLSGPDTLREAGLWSSSGEVEAAAAARRRKWRQQTDAHTGSVWFWLTGIVWFKGCDHCDGGANALKINKYFHWCHF